MPAHSIATPYHLPFRALIHEPPLFRGDRDVTVSAVFDRPLTDEAAAVFNGFMDAFWALALTGALCGDSVPPPASTIGDKSDPVREAASLRWIFTGCDLDERAVVNLVHLLLAACETQPLREVQISSTVYSGPAVPLAEDLRVEDPYPSKWPEVHFPAQIEPLVTNSRSIFMRFHEEPSPEHVAQIETDFLAWAAAAAVGAYAVAPAAPMATYVEPEMHLDVTGPDVTWGVHKIRLHPAAFDGLYNICLAIDGRITRIRDLLIE